MLGRLDAERKAAVAMFHFAAWPCGATRRQRGLLLLAAVSGAAFSAAAASVAAAPPDVVVENALVLTMRDGPEYQRLPLVVREGKFADAPAAEASAAPDARVLDLTGKYVIPGLAEMHAHVPQPRLDEPHYRDDVLFLWVANGVTRARGMLGHPSHLELRDALARHEVLGPALFTSGPSFNGGNARDPRAAGRVRRQKDAGYDFLKIHPGMPKEAFHAVAEAANAAGIRFAGHVTESVGLFASLRAGQHTIDHLDGFLETLVPPQHLEDRSPLWFGADLAPHVEAKRIPALVEALRAAGAAVVPTETLLENVAGSLAELQAREEYAYLPRNLRVGYARAVGRFDAAAAAEFLRLRKRLIKAAHSAGVPILLGSDSPQIFNVPGFSIHRELEAMVAAGLTPFDALATGTSAPAAFYQHDAHWGTIAPGRDADFVALDADPLKDIANTRRIHAVMVRGRYLDRAELDAGLAAIRER